MAPQRMNENSTPFGRFLDEHNISYAEAARELGITRERVRQLAQRSYPSLVLMFMIEDWTKTRDPKDPVTANKWREVVMATAEAKAQIERQWIARRERIGDQPTPKPPARPRRSRLRR